MKNNAAAFSLLLTLLSTLPLCAQNVGPAALKQDEKPDRSLLLGCNNVEDPGLVCCDQTICLGDTTEIIAETLSPTGGFGALEFNWIKMIPTPGVVPSWSSVQNSNTANFPAFVPVETIYLIREVRREGCPTFLASNFVTITVVPAGDPACLASSTHAADVSPFAIFPNPVDASTRLYNGAQMPAEVFIQDLNGRTLSHFKMAGGAEKNIESANWSAGVYIVRSKTSDGKVHLNKLVKL